MLFSSLSEHSSVKGRDQDTTALTLRLPSGHCPVMENDMARHVKYQVGD